MSVHSTFLPICTLVSGSCFTCFESHSYPCNLWTWIWYVSQNPSITADTRNDTHSFWHVRIFQLVLLFLHSFLIFLLVRTPSACWVQLIEFIANVFALNYFLVDHIVWLNRVEYVALSCPRKHNHSSRWCKGRRSTRKGLLQGEWESCGRERLSTETIPKRHCCEPIAPISLSESVMFLSPVFLSSSFSCSSSSLLRSILPSHPRVLLLLPFSLSVTLLCIDSLSLSASFSFYPRSFAFFLAFSSSFFLLLLPWRWVCVIVTLSFLCFWVFFSFSMSSSYSFFLVSSTRSLWWVLFFLSLACFLVFLFVVGLPAFARLLLLLLLLLLVVVVVVVVVFSLWRMSSKYSFFLVSLANLFWFAEILVRIPLAIHQCRTIQEQVRASNSEKGSVKRRSRRVKGCSCKMIHLVSWDLLVRIPLAISQCRIIRYEKVRKQDRETEKGSVKRRSRRVNGDSCKMIHLVSRQTNEWRRVKFFSCALVRIPLAI